MNALAQPYAYGSRRRLASLKWSGLVPDRDGIFIVPAGTPEMVVREVEELCERDPQFDWKHAEDAR